MKRESLRRLNSIKTGDMSTNIAIMSLFLLCGILLGAVLACSTDGVYHNSVSSDYINAVESIRSDSFEYSFWNSYFNLIKYPVIVFICSFTVFGIFAIPATVFIKGFLVSFSVSLVVKSFRNAGFIIALSIFGIQTLISLPSLVLVSAVSIETSKFFLRIFKNQKGKMQSQTLSFSSYIMFAIGVFFALLLLTFLDVAITPTIISLAVNRL